MIVKFKKLDEKGQSYLIKIEKVRADLTRMLHGLIKSKLSYNNINYEFENLYLISFNFVPNIKVKLKKINMNWKFNKENYGGIYYYDIILKINVKKGVAIDNIIDTIRYIFNDFQIFCEMNSSLYRNFLRLLSKEQRYNYRESLYEIEFVQMKPKAAKLLGELIKCTLTKVCFSYKINSSCSVNIDFKANINSKINEDQISFEVKNYEGYSDICKLVVKIESERNSYIIDNILEACKTIMNNFKIFYELINTCYEIYSILRWESSYLMLDIPDAEFNQRIVNALTMAHKKTVRDLVSLTEEEVFQIKNLGKSSIKELKTVLKQNGFELESDLTNASSLEFERYGRIQIEDISIDKDLKLDTKIKFVLKSVGINYLDELINKTDEELLEIHDIGKVALSKIKECLKILEG